MKRLTLLHVVGGQLDILLDALLFLDLVDDLLELGLGQLHDDVGEHLDEAAVGVIGEARVVGELREALDDGVVEAEVEDGVHHAGHRGAGARTDGDEQRVLGVRELFAADLLHLGEALVNLLLDIVIDLTAVGVVLGAGLGRDGEALRNRHAGLGHFGEVRALAAEELTHVLIALGEHVNEFFSHFFYLHFVC